MPRLVTGDDADDVAAYVARSVAEPGKDKGLLATAVKAAGAGEPAVAEGRRADDPRRSRTASSPTSPTRRRRPPGQLTIKMPNESARRTTSSSTARARARSSRAAATSSSPPSFTPASTRTTARSPGHREAGMEGTLSQVAAARVGASAAERRAACSAARTPRTMHDRHGAPRTATMPEHAPRNDRVLGRAARHRASERAGPGAPARGCRSSGRRRSTSRRRSASRCPAPRRRGAPRARSGRGTRGRRRSSSSVRPMKTCAPCRPVRP